MRTAEERKTLYDKINERIAAGEKIPAATKWAGVSTPTYYDWRKYFQGRAKTLRTPRAKKTRKSRAPQLIPLPLAAPTSAARICVFYGTPSDVLELVRALQ